MTFVFTFFIIIRRRAIIECALVYIIYLKVLFLDHAVLDKQFKGKELLSPDSENTRRSTNVV